MAIVKCEANGCPLSAYKGEYGMALCTFHDGKHFNDFGKITTKILRVQFAIDHYWMCKKATPYDFLTYLEKYHHPKDERLHIKENENHYQYIDRIWQKVTDYITKGVRSGIEEEVISGLNPVNSIMERIAK